MKRLLVSLMVFAGLAVALTVLRAQVSTETTATRIAGILLPFATGNPIVSGEASVRLFPRLAVVYRDLRIADATSTSADQPDFTADSITADIDILPLLIGQTSITRLVLDHPRLKAVATFDLKGITPGRAVLARLQPASIVVHRGEIDIATPDGTRHEALQAIEATLNWPRALGNLSLDGRAIWHGATVALTAQGIAPPRLASGDTGDLDVTLTAPGSRISFAGTATLSDHLQLEGLFTAHAEDPERLAGLWSHPNAPTDGSASPAHGAFPSVEITGRLRSQGWFGALSDAHVTVGSAAADGVVSARLDLARPQLRGTLAIGDIDLTPTLAAIAARWLDWAPDAMTIAGLDVDLRLSVSEASVGATNLTNVAASLLVADSQLNAEIGDATLLGGTGSLNLTGRWTDTGPVLAGRYSLAGATYGPLKSLVGFDGLPTANGPIALTGDFTSAGRTLAAVIAGLAGHADLQSAQLVLDTATPTQIRIASDLPKRFETAIARLGLAPDIDDVAATLVLAAGDLSVRKLDFRLAGLTFHLSGTASLNSHRLGLTGDAQTTPAAMPEGRSVSAEADAKVGVVPMPLSVTGTLDHPIISVARATGPDPSTEALTPHTATPN